ncbi:hypothetical protein SUGI_1228050 [Cryptomeria japonica]|uniref:Uncharacterized protein n=1 Tax=Cryptomeria japonica TaxID=3369 RepID=A0AAD3RPV1_CRYJA|nr:hypothetical protein SUGI_1228050 [Cryptomeria japonica]
MADLTRFDHSDNFPERSWWGGSNSVYRLGRVKDTNTLFQEMSWRISSEGNWRADGTSYVLFSDGWVCDSEHFLSGATHNELIQLQRVGYAHCIGA